MQGNTKPAELINEDDLRPWLGFEQRTRIEQWLTEHRIKFWHGKGGLIVTTRSAINRAMDVAANSDFDDVEFLSNGQRQSH